MLDMGGDILPTNFNGEKIFDKIEVTSNQFYTYVLLSDLDKDI